MAAAECWRPRIRLYFTELQLYLNSKDDLKELARKTWTKKRSRTTPWATVTKLGCIHSSGVGTPKVHDCGFEERRQNQAKTGAELARNDIYAKDSSNKYQETGQMKR